MAWGCFPSAPCFPGPRRPTASGAGWAMHLGLLLGARGSDVQGYEIHMGLTSVMAASTQTAPFLIEDRSDAAVSPETATDGCMDPTGRVFGTYIHGLFHNHGVRTAMLRQLAGAKGVTLPSSGFDPSMEQEFDKLADWVRSSLDMDLVYRMAGLSHHRDAGEPAAPGRS